MNNTVDVATLNDCLDNLSQLNAALTAVVQLLAGCNESNAPSASVLWQLLATLAREGESIYDHLESVKVPRKY